MALKHLFVSSKSDGADDTIVQAGDWNDVHVFDAEAANKVLAGPTSGADAVPGFRALVDADIPAAIARDAEVTADIATHAAIAASHHTKYTDAEALAAGIDDAASDPLAVDDAAADGIE
ncbi:hypothetical protein LCGC14_2760800, partial [marine sediment metagenome]